MEIVGVYDSKLLSGRFVFLNPVSSLSLEKAAETEKRNVRQREMKRERRMKS